MSDNNLHLKIQGSPFVRDVKNRAILNTNESERQAYLLRKNAIKSKENRIDMLEKRVADLEAQIKVLMGTR